MEKRLFSLKEFVSYTGLGMTKAREICKNPSNNFTVRMGNRIYVDRVKFDQHLEKCERLNVAIN